MTTPTVEHHTTRLMLEEFEYGRSRLSVLEADERYPSGHVALRFYRNALVDSVVSKFVLYGNGWVEESLVGFGVDPEIAVVREALAFPVGKSTLREVLKNSRNKLLSHGVELDIERHIQRHEDATGLSNEELSRVVPDAMDTLFDRVEALARGMDRVVAAVVAEGVPDPSGE